MKQLRKIHLLIHGFCYAGMTGGGQALRAEDPLRPYLAREERCAAGWSSRLERLAEDEALVVIPAGQAGPAAEYYARAASLLGPRFFLLDTPDCLAPEFWAGDAGYTRALLGELADALVHQHLDWNKEEVHTALHCRACCRQFAAMLGQRGYTFDPATVAAEAWGASFDGCVTKYTLGLRRMLGLADPVAITFDLTVPDAAFLLDARLRDCLRRDDGLYLFLFEHGDQIIGLYTFTAHSLADPPAYLRLAGIPAGISVSSKQGIRLWPEPEEYVLPTAPLGYYEPPQVVVTPAAGGVLVPVSAGLVYRLAKAPAYVFMPGGMPCAEARSLLMAASRQ
ncbi:MAG: hypothetical protein IT369_05230 [Candidatus Latescibacteria bacterium]|nr:hypothetical protein [Candidatus Latescibacterota bacterium]